MKRLFLVIGFLLVASCAHAFGIVEVNYTGLIKERIDTCGYGCGNVSHAAYSSDLMYAGGSVANNSVGYAQQFSISERTHINYLLASAHIDADQVPDGTVASNLFYFKLYTGTNTAFRNEPSQPYPDVYSLALATPMYVETGTYDLYYPELGVSRTFNNDGYYTDVPLAFDITLDPGTYWIAQERYPGNANLALTGEYWEHARVDGISLQFASADTQIVNPEPATMLLLGFGLTGAGLLSKRKTSLLSN